MKPTYLRLSLAAALSATLIGGCASTDDDTGRQQAFAPDWYDDGQTADDEEYLYGYGTATTPSMNTSRNQADLQARASLAQNYEEQLERMVQQGTQTTDDEEQQLQEEAARTLARNTLSGVQVDKIERYETDDDQIQTFLRVRVPAESMNEEARSVLNEMDVRLDDMEEE